MPICLASLPILPGSAAGAAALKYNIYIYIYISWNDHGSAKTPRIFW